MNYYDIVKKLVGNITPVGDTNIDKERFENLKNMVDLVDKLLTDIDYVAFTNLNKQEYSMGKAGSLANDFLNRLGIKN